MVTVTVTAIAMMRLLHGVSRLWHGLLQQRVSRTMATALAAPTTRRHLHARHGMMPLVVAASRQYLPSRVTMMTTWVRGLRVHTAALMEVLVRSCGQTLGLGLV